MDTVSTRRTRGFAGLRMMFALVAVSGILGGGCAATADRIAARAMQEGDYQKAIPYLTERTIQRPGDARAWARLGEAQYNVGQIQPAHASFSQALTLDKYLTSAHLYLGYIAESSDSADLAIWHYQVFLDQKPGGVAGGEVARRLEELRRMRAAAFARDAIAREKELKVNRYPDSTLGVVYFNSERLSEPLRPLAKGMAEMLVTDLSKVHGLHVVERLKTQRLLDELNLSHTAAFDTSSAPRLGKLLGAAHLLGGDASELSQGRLRFDPELVSTKTGDISGTKEQIGELAQFFRMEKQIVFDALKRLGYEPSPDEKTEIGKVPTESFVAFLAFSRGLDYQDLGMYAEAKREFQRAVSLDPSFRAAEDRVHQVAPLSVTGPGEQPGKLENFVKSTGAENEWTEEPADTGERLTSLQSNIGLLRPKETSDPAAQPPNPSATVIINGDFDEKGPR